MVLKASSFRTMMSFTSSPKLSPNRQKRYWRLWHSTRLWGVYIIRICWICWICIICVFLCSPGHTYAQGRICRICSIFFSICIFCIFCIYFDLWCTEQGTSGHFVSEEIQHHPGPHLSLLHSSDWAYKISGRDANFFMAISTQETAAIQSPGLCVRPAARHLWWSVLAEDRQYLVLQVASPFFNRYDDRRGNENTLMCICFSAGGIQRSQETRLYFAYSLYCAYTAYSCYDFIWLLHSLVGCVPVHHRIRAPWIRASLVCDSSVLHTGKVASCSCWQYRNNTVRDAKGSSRLSRRFLRQRKGRQRQLQVVVREQAEQLGPHWQLGYKAIMEWGSVRDL